MKAKTRYGLAVLVGVVAVGGLTGLALVLPQHPLVVQHPRWGFVAVVLVGVLAAVVTAFVPGAIKRRPDPPAQASAPPASLLHPRNKVVPWVDRSELKVLKAWVRESDPDRPDPVRLVVGGGGAGKTRLADELSGWAEGQDYACRWDRDTDVSGSLDMWRADVPRKRLLLIIDYAEFRTGLDRLLVAVSRSHRVKVLLVARSVGDWWENLRSSDALVRSLVTDQVIVPLVSGLDPQAVFTAAMAAFAERLRARAPKATLAGPPSSRILDIHVAALIAVMRHRRSRIDVSHAMGELLGHESEFWVKTNERADLGMDARQARQAVAAAALLGADTEHGLRDAFRRVDGSLDTQRHARWYQGMYPAEGSYAAGPQPDRLAELHVVTELAAERGLLERLLDGADLVQATNAIGVLGRAAADPDTANNLADDVFDQLGALIGHLSDQDPGRLARVAEAIPYPTVRFTASAAALATKVAAGYERLAGASPAVHEPDLASALGNLSIRLSDIGKQEDALKANLRAVAIYERLVEADPAVHEPDLALALGNLSVRLFDVGQQVGALKVSRRAVEMYDRLAEADPAVHEPGLARALNNLSRDLAAAGKEEDALKTSRRVVVIYERLAEANAAVHEPDLALALNNLSVDLSATGHQEGALKTSRRAVEIYDRLAEANPAVHEPGLALALNNLSAVGKQEDALRSGLRAVAIYERLAEANPAVHEPGLARALDNLSVDLSAVGKQEDALRAGLRAVAIHERLAEANPAVHEPGLALARARLIRLEEGAAGD
jgi:hypothetical protein